MKDSLDK